MTRAKTQRNSGLIGLRPKDLLCFPAKRKNSTFALLGAFASLRETGFGFACFNIQGTLDHFSHFKLIGLGNQAPSKGKPKPGPIDKDSLRVVS